MRPKARRHIKERDVANCLRAHPAYGDEVAVIRSSAHLAGSSRPGHMSEAVRASLRLPFTRGGRRRYARRAAWCRFWRRRQSKVRNGQEPRSVEITTNQDVLGDSD